MTPAAPAVTRWWRRLARPIARASLRTRVLLLAISLLALGLVTFSVVVNNALRGYLVQRVDSQLTASAEVFARVPSALALDAAQTNRLGGVLQGLFGDRTVTYLTASGTVEGVISPTASGQGATGPALPRLDAAEVAAHGQRPFTVASRDGQGLLLLARLDERSLSTPDDEGHSGALPLDLAPMDLRTLAADALHEVRALDPTRPVELTGPGGGAPTSAPALADESRMRQVVINLVGNAVAHTPEATAIRIGVGTLGAHSVLEVADQGPGLTAEQGRRIFERFYRADESRSRTSAVGAGLGLAIVQSLVTAHGGRVELQSEPGAGATFRVLLPHLTDHETDAPD